MRVRQYSTEVTLIIFIIISLLFINRIKAQGPNAPEASAFEPVDATDMVSLTTGDMTYVMPIMNVPSTEGGYPIVLSYHGGIGYDQEASWVGLGWNLNPGAINRAINGYPDDWKNVKVIDREYFESWGKNVSLSVGYGRFDVALGYSWDSNGGQKGSVGIGVGVSSGANSKGRIGVGLSYGNDDGWGANFSLGFNNKNGFGVGIYADTNGVIGVSAGHSTTFGGDPSQDVFTGSASTIGISLSSNKGKVGVGLSGGGSNVLANNGGSQNTSSFGFGVAFYLYGAFISLSYDESTYSRFKHDEDYVYGPLYYSELSNNPVSANNSDISYPSTFSNTHNRDSFMDAYEQPIPELINNVVAYNNVFQSQKPSYNSPAYDAYEVNAQGLSGRMSPRLLDNGLILNRGLDYEYDEVILDSNACAWPYCDEVTDPLTGITAPTSPLMCASFEGRGQKIKSKKIYSNSHFSNQTPHKFRNTFGQNNSKLNFYFDYQFPANLEINNSVINNYNASYGLENYFQNNGTIITNRQENSNFIETFTNQQIVDLINQGGSFLEAKDYSRISDEGYRAHGIGGYRITTTDGKTYHYSRPVYHFEDIYRQLVPKDDNEDGVSDGVYSEYGDLSESFYREVKKTEPFATHWLLTAITGPDYIKKSNHNYPSEGDYGYWVRFDYGKWTDGYVWRTPYNGYNNLSVNKTTISNEYSWGRKQLVYLDKVVTNTHTALFIKSIREDNLGKNIGEGGYPTNEGGKNEYNVYDSDASVRYLNQKPLKLDEIILLRNNDYNNSIQPNTQISNITDGPTSHTVDWYSMPNLNYLLNQQNQIIDNGDLEIDPNNGKYIIYDKAIKVIKLNQNYELAQESPNSTSTTSQHQGNKGRLTLKEVEVLGKMGTQVMPPYSFEYLGKDINYEACSDLIDCEKDDWGYHKDDSALWSLNKIHTPTGGIIEFEYEEDEYYTEAFSRRLFNEDNLKFKVYMDSDNNAVLEYRKSNFWTEPINFLEYFDSNDPTWGSIYVCHSEADTVFETGDRDWLYIRGHIPLQIKEVTTDKIIFYMPINDGSNADWDTFHQVTGQEFREKGGWHCFIGNDCQDNENNSAYVFNFKLLANRTPGTGTGGGIRVKEISTIDELDNKYSTNYNYSHPTLDRTSGITSYAPTKGEKYVAYRREIPAPRIMYEYVTLTEKGINNVPLGKTQYKFNVLKPVINIFDPNMQAGEYFKSTTTVNEIDSQQGTIGVEVKLEDNFAMLGSVVEVLQINNENQIISQTKNNYLSLDELRSDIIEKPGYLQESFHSLKSIYDYHYNYILGNANLGIVNYQASCDIDESIFLSKRIANSSQKKIYPVVQNQTVEVNGNQKFTTKYSNVDPKTGFFLTTKTQLADNTWVKTDIIPAYTKYSQMGSKVDNINNKHMLTQEAMTTTSWSNYGNTYGWETLSANITTWYNDWRYRDVDGSEYTPSAPNEKIWRKQKNFIWKDDVDPEKGTYLTTVDSNNDYFDWVNNEPNNNKWQKVSETTRYTHWSSPLESKDINDNHVSSKMADADTKVVASGNARFTEMFYSGAEYNIDGTYLDQEIKGAQFRDSTIAHTGDNSLKINTFGDKVFETKLKANEHDADRYKISVWVHCSTRFLSTVHIEVNGEMKPFNGEKVIAGKWTQLNHYEYLDSGEQNVSIVLVNIYNPPPINNFIEAGVYLDDFRIHPVYISMNSYVYDNDTDELTYILDANNMATKYVYDKAGRLCKLYKEIETNLPETDGGFKLINQYKYHYKNGDTANNCYCCEDGSNTGQSPLYIKSLSQDNKGDYIRVFNVDAQGGSENYSYEWRWLIDYETNTFSDFVSGLSKQDVPFAAELCDYKNSTYNKVWKVEVKITDNVTGETTTKMEEVKIKDCKFVLNDDSWADIEISTNYNTCNALTEYTFRPFVIKPSHDNYSYSFRTFNHLSNEWSSYSIINNEKNNFCGDVFFAPSTECSSTYSIYQTIQYRIVDNETGEVFQSNILDVYLDCVENPNNSLMLPSNSDHIKYNNFGNVVKKNSFGEIINVYNMTGK
ncbi:MAG: hypothetical protein ACK5M1_13890 [Xanthomarina gelatinilytica]|uniref:hypothetical protein n=1 Tax=Xanthomarina gelatinilytica TaxID=1137281 RepID=UPI003A876EE0